jgi:hypothetical protein
MQIRQSVPLVFAALALAGCMKPNPLIYTLGGDSGEHDAGDGDAGDGDPDDGDPDESGSALSDMPGDEVCEPLEAFDPGCNDCLELDCCDLARACADVDECLCMADCVFAGGSPGTCKNGCGGVSPSEIDELTPLLDCATAACQPAC